MTLTPNQIRDYHADGFTIVEGLISPGLLKEIAEHLDRAALGQLDSGIAVQVEPEVQRLDIRPENPLNRIRKVSRVVRHDSFFRSVATCEPILSCMRDILGDNLRFFGDEAQLKPAFFIQYLSQLPLSGSLWMRRLPKTAVFKLCPVCTGRVS